jgi:hypothetical protein
MATRHLGSRPRKGNRSSTARGADPHPDREPVPEESIAALFDQAPPPPGDQEHERGQKADSEGHAYGVPVPEGLHEAIETERGNLAKAESLLGCMVIAMEYETDSVTGPYYPDVARIARDMVRQSINSLDSLTLQQLLLRNKIKDDTDLLMIGSACFVMGRAGSSDTGVCRYRH